MKKILLLVVTGFLIGSCSTDRNVPQYQAVFGKWNWIESTGGIAGMPLTPQSTGNTIQLEITKTTIGKYVDGKLESEQTYTIQIEPSIFGGEKPMIIYENDSKSSFEIKNNQLFLNEECNDCFLSTYQKE
ncbi:hypothetical protein [Flavobacterium ovatum]|uniref:hypothetical protein n=1 Tax=Flavobacterium ovatum TaxID=1928857 RepID=UPI0034503FC9